MGKISCIELNLLKSHKKNTTIALIEQLKLENICAKHGFMTSYKRNVS